MTRTRAMAIMTGLSMIMGGAPALSGQQVYTYSVVHPYYGKIGTLTDTIDRSPEVTRIDARLRIAVELLGIVVYRQESDTTEVLRGGRLISLQSLSNKDGLRFEVHGEAQGNQFVVNATSGSFAGPATTAPSDPWVLQHIGEGTLVYPSTGKIIGAQVSGGDYETISVNGASLSARHFAVMGDNREDVWLDNLGIPVMFSTVEDSTTIKFVLESAKPAASVIKVTSMTRPALALPGNSHR